MGQMKRVLIIATCIFGATACLTPSEKRAMQNDIFTLQTRTVQMESLLRDRSNDLRTNSDKASKRIASTATELDRLRLDIQIIKGEIDALRVGVQSGQMPDANPNDSSVANTLKSILARMEAIESSQEKLLAIVERAPTPSRTATAKKSTGNLDKDFRAKNWPAVLALAPQKLKATKNLSKQQKILYYFAESLYQTKKVSDAALKFNEYLDAGGTKYKTKAKLRLGDCFRELGDTATAKTYYEELLRDFPKSKEAAQAKKALRKLG